MHAAVGVVGTWPAALSPLSRMAGHPDGDVWNHAWGAWWFWTKLGRGELPWHCSELYGPEGGTLWYIDPLGAGLTSLLVPVLGTVGAWNALQWASVAFASWAAALLARRVAGDGLHVYAASIVVALGPYLNGELHNGISEACNLGPGLLTLALADAAFREGRLRTWISAGLALGVTALGTPYYAIATLLCLVVWSIPWLWGRPGVRQLGGAVAAALSGAAVALPAAFAVRASVEAADALVHRGDPSMVPALLLHNGVDPRTFVAPFGFTSVDYAELGEAFVHSGYLGLVALVLAARGVWRTGRWGFAAGGFVAVLFSLGPWLFWDGTWLELQGRRFAMPYQLLELLIPGQAITHSLRLAVPGLAVVAALASAGLLGLGLRPLLAGLGALALDMLWLGGPAWPLARTPVLDLDAAEAIASTVPASHGDLVLDLPGAVEGSMATSRYLVYQTAHGRPLPYRPDARASSASLLGSDAFTLMAAASETRPSHQVMLVRAAKGIRTLKREDLVQRGVQFVVVHRELERGDQDVAATEELLTLLYGEPEVHGDHAVYAVAGTGTVRVPRELHAELLSGREDKSVELPGADGVQSGHQGSPTPQTPPEGR